MTEKQDQKSVENVKDKFRTMVFHVCRHSGTRFSIPTDFLGRVENRDVVIEECNTCHATREVKVREAPTGKWQKKEEMGATILGGNELFGFDDDSAMDEEDDN